MPVWTRLCPVDVLRHPVVAGVAKLLAAPDIQAALHEGQRAGTYPAEVVAALRRIGVARLYTDEAEVFHLCGLNAIAAAVDGSLAITLGVNALALLPVHLGAGPELRAQILKKINDGAFAAMLLTELDHGSNLLRNEAAAAPHPDGGYRLSGEKHLINGATHHDVLVALMRTARGGAVAFGDFSVFCVDRDDSVEALPRWSTLPARAADIAGVRFHGTHVPEDSLVGKLGDGFSLVQRTLTLSRGGISGLASGSASGRSRWRSPTRTPATSTARRSSASTRSPITWSPTPSSTSSPRRWRSRRRSPPTPSASAPPSTPPRPSWPAALWPRRRSSRVGGSSRAARCWPIGPTRSSSATSPSTACSTAPAT
nr:acyl-CoA dehydrogenase family protein [Nannocystis pusilla]